MPYSSASFRQNVFINCPFDEPYSPIFNAIVFSVHDMGFRPRCALEASNAGQARLDKILDIIAQCKFSVHDLSRIELDKTSGLPRFNMPLELGLDLGCRRFGKGLQREKICLVLDSEPYRYQVFISDISGQDVYAHGNEPRNAIKIVRDWLRLEVDEKTKIVPGGARIHKRYLSFQKMLPEFCALSHWDIASLPFADFSFAVATWVKDNPL